MADDRRAFRHALLVAAAICILPIIVWWWWCASATTLLMLRHADRTPPQDALNPAGVTRANELVHVATKAGVEGIYHSEAIRTRQTAEPLATALGITPVAFPAADTAGLVAHVFANHRGGTVLVVGHSDSVPRIIAEVGGPTLPNIDDGEFDNLFVLTVCRCRWGVAKVVNLQYGAASP